ncbi:ATP synthase F1, delta subunit [Bifidobacterium longum subsp. infantis CCUG 52486]|nr:ATP synthase F1, delta subunit [Bifidobacterium longum subsp. infantis CCUG 52486]
MTMRGEASRIADRESRDSLAPKLRDTREDAWRIGNELFTITKVLDDSIQLERALTDPSRPVADKVAVLKELLGDNAHPMTMEIMTDLVSRRWSRARDIANAVEDFGVDAMMYYADATDATLQVSIELSELHSALLNLPVVRAKLYDYQATSEARVKLFREVFSGKTLNKVTMRLAEHATCNLRRRRYLETIQWLINKFSRHMGESMVTVTTATPLKKEQIKRLVEVYSAKVGRQVHINSVVDPTVLGGMRIQVGDEVTDNTVVAQLQNLHRKVQTEATPA